jgi:hypothetical protein
MEVSGQLHAPTALFPGKVPRYPYDRKLVWTMRNREIFFALVGNQTPAVQPVARHYTDWAIPAPNLKYTAVNALISINLPVSVL